METKEKPVLLYDGPGQALIVQVGVNHEAARVDASRGLVKKGYQPVIVHVWGTGQLEVFPDKSKRLRYVVLPDGEQATMVGKKNPQPADVQSLRLADVQLEHGVVPQLPFEGSLPQLASIAPPIPGIVELSELTAPQASPSTPIPGTHSTIFGGTPYIVVPPSKSKGFFGSVGVLPPK